MTETGKMLEKFPRTVGSQRYRETFGVLEASGLRPLGKSNTETLLFQAHNKMEKKQTFSPSDWVGRR